MKKILTLVLMMCGVPTSALAQMPGGVCGYVIDEKTHERMPNVNVFIFNRSAGIEYKRTTDGNGFFCDITLGEGDYSVFSEGKRTDTGEHYEGMAFTSSRGGNSARVSVHVTRNIFASYLRPVVGLVQPNVTADLYLAPILNSLP
jgi:hypothetical protein